MNPGYPSVECLATMTIASFFSTSLAHPWCCVYAAQTARTRAGKASTNEGHLTWGRGPPNAATPYSSFQVLAREYFSEVLSTAYLFTAIYVRRTKLTSGHEERTSPQTAAKGRIPP